MTDECTDTKQKIMKEARVLFANQGFEGTSVREIAKAAKVNVASLNYHFSNKENLFIEIIRAGYIECSIAMRTHYEESHPSLEDFLVHFFNYFAQKSHDLVSSFKMMMSTQHSHQMAAQGSEDEMIGPPGGQVIAEAIKERVGPKVSEEDIHWAVRTLFSHVIHNSLMYNCCFKQNKIPFTETSDIEKGIRRLTKVVVRELAES